MVNSSSILLNFFFFLTFVAVSFFFPLCFFKIYLLLYSACWESSSSYGSAILIIFGFPIHSFSLILPHPFLLHLRTMNKSVSSDMFLSLFLSNVLCCLAHFLLYLLAFPCDVCYTCLFILKSVFALFLPFSS